MWQVFVLIEGKWYEEAPATSYAEALSLYETLNDPAGPFHRARRVIRKVVN